MQTKVVKSEGYVVRTNEGYLFDIDYYANQPTIDPKDIHDDFHSFVSRALIFKDKDVAEDAAKAALSKEYVTSSQVIPIVATYILKED